MSGPFGVRITVISGQKYSREIVVAASTFLAMGFLSIDPVANSGAVRPEFLRALDIFRRREDLDYREKPDYFAERIIKPSNTISTEGLFWLALDKEGEDIAKKILEANRELPEKKIYGSVHKLNMIERPIVPPPQVYVPLTIWEVSKRQHSSLPIKYRELKSKGIYHSYIISHAPLTPEQKSYCDWCESLYESLIFWQDTIKSIQSDFS